MARLIDADTLKGYLMRSAVYAWDVEQDEIAHRWVLHAIDNAPTIDMVRCEDCVHWGKWNNHTGSCERLNKLDIIEGGWFGADADDFCSFAERKDND